MKKIASFTVDHTTLERGLYVSRKDAFNGVTVTTFDMRMTVPNREPAMETAALHTVEHLAATFLRSHERAGEVVYFGPMGCRTGCYLVMFGDLEPQDVYDLIIETCDFISSYEGDIPGATARECGNYLDQNLTVAKFYIDRYKSDLTAHKRFTYR